MVAKEAVVAVLATNRSGEFASAGGATGSAGASLRAHWQFEPQWHEVLLSDFEAQHELASLTGQVFSLEQQFCTALWWQQSLVPAIAFLCSQEQPLNDWPATDVLALAVQPHTCAGKLCRGIVTAASQTRVRPTMCLVIVIIKV